MNILRCFAVLVNLVYFWALMPVYINLSKSKQLKENLEKESKAFQQALDKRIPIHNVMKKLGVGLLILSGVSLTLMLILLAFTSISILPIANVSLGFFVASRLCSFVEHYLSDDIQTNSFFVEQNKHFIRDFDNMNSDFQTSNDLRRRVEDQVQALTVDEVAVKEQLLSIHDLLTCVEEGVNRPFVSQATMNQTFLAPPRHNDTQISIEPGSTVEDQVKFGTL